MWRIMRSLPVVGRELPTTDSTFVLKIQQSIDLFFIFSDGVNDLI